MQEFTKDNVGHVRDGENLSSYAKNEGWFLARKKVLTPMLTVEGPLTVETQEGTLELGEDFQGYIAVDQAGYPYPIESAEFEKTYDQA